MLLQKERSAIVRSGKRILARALTSGTSGNLSIFNRRRRLIAISPSAVLYDEMVPEDVVVVDLDAGVAEGARKPPSELVIHLALYRKRSDIQSVVHTHSVYATTFACLNWEIPVVQDLIGYCGYKVPLAPYATFGTPELARNVADTIGDGHAVLLANHGLVAAGPDLDRAFTVAEEIELVVRSLAIAIRSPIVTSYDD